MKFEIFCVYSIDIKSRSATDLIQFPSWLNKKINEINLIKIGLLSQLNVNKNKPTFSFANWNQINRSTIRSNLIKLDHIKSSQIKSDWVKSDYWLFFIIFYVQTGSIIWIWNNLLKESFITLKNFAIKVNNKKIKTWKKSKIRTRFVQKVK